MKLVAVEDFRLLAAQGGAGFDEGDAGGVAKACDGAGGADHVGHHRAAAGAEFGEPECVRAAEPDPFVGRPQAEEFAEDLAGLAARW